ncbi:MAG: V-type ATP synthase subunit E family protein [bacterium]
MALKNVIEKISQDANTEASKNIKEAGLQADKILQVADKKSEMIRTKVLEQGRVKADKIHEQAVSAAVMWERNEILKSKQKTLQEVYEELSAKMQNLSDEEHKQLLSKLLKGLPTEGEIVATKKSQSLLRDLVSQAGLNLASETIAGDGGFMYRSDEIDIDQRFESVLKSLREETEAGAANKLFN